MRLGLIVTAAGKGTRFGHPDGKQFASLLNQPVILHTLQAFSRITLSQAVVTFDPDTIPALENLLKGQPVPYPIQVIAGAETRSKSVRLAFEALGVVDRVMIHDGARPNVTHELILRLLADAARHDAVIPGVPVIDTIKWIEGQRVAHTVDRDKLVAIQTPQIFDYALLKQAYETVDTAGATDESMLMEKMGIPVYVTPGDPDNIKLTVPRDLAYLTVAMRERTSENTAA